MILVSDTSTIPLPIVLSVSVYQPDIGIGMRLRLISILAVSVSVWYKYQYGIVISMVLVLVWYWYQCINRHQHGWTAMYQYRYELSARLISSNIKVLVEHKWAPLSEAWYWFVCELFISTSCGNFQLYFHKPFPGATPCTLFWQVDMQHRIHLFQPPLLCDHSPTCPSWFFTPVRFDLILVQPSNLQSSVW